MTSHNGFENLGVELVRVSHQNPFEMFWDWYKETWLSLHDVEYNPNNDEHVAACVAVTNRQALPTPMEVLNFEVRITGLSRVALAQITRGRVGHCYNVQSQMPQHIEHSVTIPKNIYEHPIFGQRAMAIQEMLASLYNEMYDSGIPPQDCRYMTLHGQQTTLMWNVNFGALLGWYSRRCENGLTDELNIVGRMLRRELIKMFLNDDGTEKQRGSGWKYLIDKLDCIGAAQGKCMNGDKVFGNTGRHPSAGPWVPSKVNEQMPADYDFSRSAFFYELLELDQSLLFSDEAEMIEDWKTIGFDARLKKLDG